MLNLLWKGMIGYKREVRFEENLRKRKITEDRGKITEDRIGKKFRRKSEEILKKSWRREIIHRQFKEYTTDNGWVKITEDKDKITEDRRSESQAI